MTAFTGFPAGRLRYSRIPQTFFAELLPRIDHLGEMKVTLYALWFFDRQQGRVRYIRYRDFANDQQLVKGLGASEEAALSVLVDSLEKAVLRGTLLRIQRHGSDLEDAIYVMNTPRGRAAIHAFEAGNWAPEGETQVPATLDLERPNIFRLYEEHIGPLTPMIAEDLKEAEKTYPQEWIEQAIRIAVRSNVRRWKYVDGILRSWQERGRDGTYQGDSEEDRFRYIKGKYAEFGDF